LDEAAGQRDRNAPDRRASAPGDDLNRTICGDWTATARHCSPPDDPYYDHHNYDEYIRQAIRTAEQVSAVFPGQRVPSSLRSL
jgi:hypothetical protein